MNRASSSQKHKGWVAPDEEWSEEELDQLIGWLEAHRAGELDPFSAC
jgi:hypothetical protein